MIKWQFTLEKGRIMSAARLDGSGRIARRTGPLWTLKEFCRRAGKSRRQIYRDVLAGKIHPLGKFMDTWIIEPSEMARLIPPPRSMASLFPEYDWKSLDCEKNAALILSRVLEIGGRERLRWAFSYFGEDAVKRFVRDQGVRRLGPRACRYWRLHFGLNSRPQGSRRRKGRLWGGG